MELNYIYRNAQVIGMESPNREMREAADLLIQDEVSAMEAKGSSPLEVQTFLNGANRAKAAELPDYGKMGRAAEAAAAYKANIS